MTLVYNFSLFLVEQAIVEANNFREEFGREPTDQEVSEIAKDMIRTLKALLIVEDTKWKIGMYF